MENSSNQVPSNVVTDNPQATQSAELGAGAIEFQQAVPSDSLNDQSLSLGLEGSVVEVSSPPFAPDAPLDDAQLPVFWVAAIGLIVAVGIFLLYKLIREAIAENELSLEVPAPEAVAGKPKTTKKKTSSNRKRSAPNQRLKKSAKKRK